MKTTTHCHFKYPSYFLVNRQCSLDRPIASRNERDKNLLTSLMLCENSVVVVVVVVFFFLGGGGAPKAFESPVRALTFHFISQPSPPPTMVVHHL